MRCIGVDLGDIRTGLAIGDTETRHALPLGMIDVPIAQQDGESLLDALLERINEAVAERDLCMIVLGLPLNMDGSEGPRAAIVRGFADRLARRSGRSVIFHDERLTSAQADWTLARSGLTHTQKKARRDALAAAAMLGDYLRSLPDTRAQPRAGE